MNAARAETKPWHDMGKADAWLTPGRFALLLGLVIAATFPRVLLGKDTFIIRDFGMFGYPVAYFHRQSFWRGELPLWNPYSNCGLPFLAQWNTLTLYPFSLLYLVLPLTWSLPLFCLGHLFWGGMGMYFLAFRWTNHRLAAALAGVIFSFNGLSLNALAWPNIEATLGWLPWVVLLAQRAWLGGGKAVVWAVLAAAVQVLAGGPEPVLFTALILIVLACGDWINRTTARGLILLRSCLMAALVALVCAAQMAPFLELLAHSQRDSGFGTASHDWSMPFWGWANFLVPLFRTSPTAQGVCMQNGQYWTSSYYAGIATVLLAVIAVWRVRDWRVRAMAGLVLLALVLAWGDSTLLYRGLRFCFPGLGFVRYPIKFVIVVLALAPLLAAFGFAAMADASRITHSASRAHRVEVVGALMMLLLIAAIVVVERNSPLPADAWRATWQSGLSRAGFLILVCLIVIALLGAEGHRRVLLGCCLLVVFWLDFVTHAPTQNPGAKAFVYTPNWARTQLALNPPPKVGGSRTMLMPRARDFLRFNPLTSLEETYLRNRLAIRANCNLLDELPQVDGVFSLAPREMSHVTTLLYDHGDQGCPGLLDFLGVSHTTAPGTTCEWTPRASALPLVTAGQQAIFADDRVAFDALSQTNLDLSRFVFLPPEAQSSICATQQTTVRVLDPTFAAQSIRLRTEAPAPSLVVMSQTYYPAWKAYVDGRPTRIWRANYAFQALEVPAGRHQVLLAYEDDKLMVGALLSSLGLLTCALLWWRASVGHPLRDADP